MEIFILIITIFPVIVALVLKGKYFKLVLGLALINAAVAIIAQRHNPNATTQYLVISTFNIIFACIIWYLSFKKKSGTIIDNQQSARKVLSAGGWVIVLGVIAIIAAFIYLATSVGLGG